MREIGYESKVQRRGIGIVSVIITDEVKTGLDKELERFEISLTAILTFNTS